MEISHDGGKHYPPPQRVSNAARAETRQDETGKSSQQKNGRGKIDFGHILHTFLIVCMWGKLHDMKKLHTMTENLRVLAETAACQEQGWQAVLLAQRKPAMQTTLPVAA